MLWVFLAFVVLLSGVVAYAADTIARKAGRKHIRWFGLRPKTTALVVAVLSGMAISAASLTAFLLLNKNAVDIIAAADQLRPQLESLRREYAAAKDDLKAANAERDAARKEAERVGELQAAAQRDLRATRADLETAQQAEQRLKAETATLQGRVKTLGTTITTLEGLAKENRVKLQASEAALKASQARAQTLDAQVLDFRARTALAQQEAQNAQDRAATVQASADRAQARAATAEAAARTAQARALQVQEASARAQVSARQALAQVQAQAQAARTQADALRTQVGQLGASRQAAQQDLQNAKAALATARTALAAAQTARAQAERQRQAAQAARDTVAAERSRVAAQRDQLVADRDRITRQRDQAQGDLVVLQQQQLALKSSNDALSRDLATARTTLGKLQDEYSSSRAELNASRNTDLAYPKNDLVYAAVVPSVRNLDGFLKDADRAAQTRGAKGSPAVRLASGSRAALETTLRGLNTSTFVQCRAAQNAALGFPVDLSCDARPNTVLFHRGDIIRRISVNLKAEPRVIQDQISELVKDTVVDITTRGVPDEYILNQGLDVNEFIALLTRLNARSDATAVVGMAARDDVKPSTRVDLYPILP
ncbi:chromosome segregation ATPase [Deinococcus metalli]|uniref:Chromosome segregation ATPase n=1 Tax=Deinococcus metalli TaxID=1141878 RepID=A0A7W8NNV9_9DEIO|nr:DUF3084 domain-containing protein [Deinococcus metalli]MBB5377329.1 chromosome segregation ATPase [Deinococcus metalli]GHF49683.1 hypothetical protein GCM10017781_27560 [Deinococcus metalli]